MQNIITLQSKLKKLIIGIMLAFVVLLALMFYFFAENQISEKYENEAKGVINYTHLLLSKTFQDAERGLETVVNHAINQSDYASFLNVVYETIESASTLYIGDDDGNFHLYPKRFVAEDYDPRNRDWYKNAIGKPGVILWSDPYIDHGTGEFTVSASKTLKLWNKEDGVVGVDLLLRELKTVVDQATIGKNGFVTIVNSNGDIISHKDADYLAQQADDSQLFEIPFVTLIESKNAQNGNNHLYYVQPFEKGNLYIIATVYKSDIHQSLFGIYFIEMGIVLVLLVIGERIAVKYAKKITKPVYELKKVMEKVSDGDYDVVCDETSDDEMGVLIEGFNQMIQSIYENKSEMQSLYEELYASEETLKDQYDQLFENREFIKKSEERYKLIFDGIPLI
jgi:methyl-accepting chemotaxis protein